MKTYFFLLLILFFSIPALALSRFEDIDKNPIGAYGGQALFGGVFSFGIPMGSSIDAEDSFIEDTVYTFEEQEVSKTVVISHLASCFSLFAEYMFIDRVGARLTFNRNSIVQRTHFGKDYKNTSLSLFEDTEFVIGPAFHATVREAWDVVLIPSIGIAFCDYTPAPSANYLFDEFEQDDTFSQSVLTWSIELQGIYYFTNGVFIAGGLSWSTVTLTFDSFERIAPSPSTEFNKGSGEVDISILRFNLGAGYALFH